MSSSKAAPGNPAPQLFKAHRLRLANALKQKKSLLDRQRKTLNQTGKP
jgi:hypothetical protein